SDVLSGSGPDGELVTARIDEVEPLAAGEREDGLGDLAARIPHGLDEGGQVVPVEDDERPAGDLRLAHRESARQAAVPELAILRTIVGELPAEYGAVEGLH